MGTVCPLGNNWRDTWQAMVDGRSGIAQLTQFPTDEFEVKIGGEVRDFRPEEAIPTKELRRMDKNGQFAVVCALEAVADAGLVIDESNRDDVGVIFGSAGGGYGLLLEQYEIYKASGYRRVSPFLISNMLPDAASGHVAIQLGAAGPNMSVVSACSTGTAAIGESWETIRRGDAEAVIAGGTDNPLLPVLMAGFHALARARRRQRAPRPRVQAVRQAAGWVRRRAGRGGDGARVAGLREGARRGDLRRGHRLRVEQRRARHGGRARERPGLGDGDVAGCEEGRHRAAEVDYINPHGTGTPLNDRAETAAIKEAFGEHAYRLAISSTKALHGHLMGGAGALEAIAAVQAIRTGIIPPTINYEVPDPDCDLDYVPNEARKADVRVSLSNSVGLGGHNASVIFRRYED